MLLEEEIDNLFKDGNTVAKVLDVVLDWDCEFTFSDEEILAWYKNSFYIFLKGRHCFKHDLNAGFRKNWKKSSIYKRGLKSIYAKICALAPSKSVYFEPAWISGIKQLEDYPFLEDIEDTFRESFIRIGKKKFPVRIPVRVKTARYRPKPGFNPVFRASKYPYKYNIGLHTYVFGWARSKNFTDVTDVLKGIGDYPTNVEYIHFDLNMDVKVLGAYPFLVYLLRKRMRYATYSRYIDFISQRIVL